VRLLKDSGKTCTVSFERLSPPDRDYVLAVANAAPSTVVARLAGN
jgi:hypothetical protein